MVAKIKDLVSNLVHREDDEYYDEYGYDEYEELEEEFEEEEVNERAQSKINFSWPKSNKVISMQENQNAIKMKIVKPNSFEQAKDVCVLLRNKYSVVLNLEYVPKEVGRRFLDYVSGAVDFAEGKVEKVSNSVFVIAPFNYDIVNDTKEQKFETKMATPWRN